MIPGLLLVVLLFTRSAYGNEANNFPCEPRDVKIVTTGQRILLTWTDDPSCLELSVEFKSKLVVSVGDQEAHWDEVVMKPDQMGSTHHWSWTSYLPLECVSHSVQLTYQYQNLTSQQKQAKTDPGLGFREMPVFPQDQIFLVGTRATFCCVLPAGETARMYVDGYDSRMNTTVINNQTLVLSVDLSKPSMESGDNVKCDTNTTHYGTCVYVGYPPLIEGLVCETKDLKSVDCRWTNRRNTNIEVRNSTEYRLQGKKCPKEPKGKCSQNVTGDVGKKIWTLKAENVLGSVVVTDEADLRERVHMLAPERVTTSSVNARNVSVKWEWAFHIYTTLNLTCQIELRQRNAEHTSHVSGVGLNFATLNQLTPNTAHTVRVRCGTVEHFWKWSEWSSLVEFHTKGDVPDALDVWMQQNENKYIVIWKKPLDSQSHGEVLDYEVTWAPVKSPTRQERVRVSPFKHRAVLALDPREEFLINVTVRNINGSSAPSTIRTPIHSPEMNRKVSLRILGHNGGFHVSWTSRPLWSCGYIVDWFPATSQNQTVDWKKVPPNVTNADITSTELTDGVRYLISIYACTPGAPELLERREGYVKEKRIKDNLFTLNWNQMDKDVTVSWDPVDLGTQTAFIRGYTLYCSDDKNIITNVSTDDPTATSLTVRKLQITSYTFTVKALTAVGECGASSVTATLNSPTDKLMLTVVITLVLVTVLLVFISILCFRKWTSIKKKIFPPVPKPMLKGGFAWLGEGSPHAAFSDHKSDEQIVKVSLLHLKQQWKGFSQSALPPANNDYLNVIPSTMCDLLNLSYNLTMDTQNEQVTSAAHGQDKSIVGFNLQQAIDKAQTDPGHLTCCDSAYITAPV